MARFDGFVLFAEMRTGSNALEEAINLYAGLSCHGEVFNPAFIGHQGQDRLLGITTSEREADPLALLDAVLGSGGLAGFRFFHDHDPRILERILPNPRIAKIILSRNPLDAFVSRKIAEATGQWKLTDAKDRKRARIDFDPVEYQAVAAQHAAFQARLRRGLQETGQAAFHIDHSEISDVAVLNGLARYLGSDATLDRVRLKLKRQNPEPLAEKVTNPEALEAVAGTDEAIATVAEPARGANVRTWVAGAEAPLLFMPLKGGPTARVEAWLAAVDGVAPDQLTRNFMQKTLKQWKNHNKDGRSFTVVCHPVERAHRVFCTHILGTGPGAFLEIREALRTRYEVPLPASEPGVGWSASDHRAAFLGFLRFAKASNAGQTSLRSDPAWASQAVLLAGTAHVLVPDAVLRDGALDTALPALSAELGLAAAPVGASDDPSPIPLAAIYNDEVEEAVRSLHNRDFMAFGFRRWQPPPSPGS